MSDPFNRTADTDFFFDLFPRVLRGGSNGSKQPDSDASGSCGRLDKGACHYRMDYTRRGVAAILNQAGSECDRGFVANDIKSLSRTFTRLGFELETFNDLDLCEIENEMETLSQMDHTDCDCFVLVYLNRGSDGKLRARDRLFDVNLLWGGFTAEKTPSLANKPKVFIIHGYREMSRARKVRHGESPEDCALFEDDEEPGSDDTWPDRLRSYYIPDRSDFLIVLSSVQGLGKDSRQSSQIGSLYIQTLCRNLDSLGFDQDMLSILTEVNRQILDVVQDTSMHYCDSCKSQSQIPTVISLLIRILQFTQKSSDSRVKRKAVKLEKSSEEMVGTIEEDTTRKSSIEKKKIKRSASGSKLNYNNKPSD